MGKIFWWFHILSYTDVWWKGSTAELIISGDSTVTIYIHILYKSINS